MICQIDKMDLNGQHQKYFLFIKQVKNKYIYLYFIWSMGEYVATLNNGGVSEQWQVAITFLKSMIECCCWHLIQIFTTQNRMAKRLFLKEIFKSDRCWKHLEQKHRFLKTLFPKDVFRLQYVLDWFFSSDY